jgi:uncharacterized protein YndB with AHSA1/START domain
MPATLHNEIEIPVPAERLFDYVTQPWLWHEWHPSSRSASAANKPLAVGDEFEEFIEVQPLAPLPPRLKRKTLYQVKESVPYQTWTAEGRMKDGWVRIRYDFEEKGKVTFFARTLDFSVSGPNRILLPWIRSSMEKLSLVALNNLKNKMQAVPHEP